MKTGRTSLKLRNQKSTEEGVDFRSRTDEIKSVEDIYNDKIIEASLLNSKNNRASENLELYKSLSSPLDSSTEKNNNYYQNNTILNLEENLTRSTIETEERATFLYKVIMKMLEKHLNDKQHPLNHLLNYYIDYFIGKVERESCLKDGHNDEEVQLKIDDVKNFMGVMRNAIYIFYNFSELCFKIKKTFNIVINLFTYENLTNFFTSYFFNKFEIYDVLFDMLRELNEEKDALLTKNLKILKNWTPNDFGISETFTLDFLTYRHLQKKNKVKAPFSKLQRKFKKDNQNFNENVSKEKKEEIKDNITLEENSIKTYQNKSTLNKSDKTVKCLEPKAEKETVDYMPYFKAIEKLNVFVQLKSPLHQLKILNESFELIIDSITEFYLDFNVLFDKYIESDDLISIVLYVISQSDLPFLTSHIRIIDNFITQNYLYNIIGYQFVTLKACLNYIENISEIENRKDQKYSVIALKESILIDIKKEADSHHEKKTFII